jgi:hypothetical protein
MTGRHNITQHNSIVSSRFFYQLWLGKSVCTLVSFKDTPITLKHVYKPTVFITESSVDTNVTDRVLRWRHAPPVQPPASSVIMTFHFLCVSPASPPDSQSPAMQSTGHSASSLIQALALVALLGVTASAQVREYFRGLFHWWTSKFYWIFHVEPLSMKMWLFICCFVAEHD